ncbi:unnamed protein product [Closterium sp. NIES-54]
MPLAECAHFGQRNTAKALYNTVVARYSSPTTAALGRLLLPYLLPKLSAFATVEDLCTSDPRYRSALPAKFLHRNPPLMYITLYFIVTRLPDSLRAVRDQFLALDPTNLTVDLLDAEGDCYLCVPPGPGIEAAALGASESALPGTTPAEALHTCTLDSGASRCFFHDSTTLRPLSAPAPFRLAGPSRGLVFPHSSTFLPCPAVPSGSLSGLHLPSFSTNLVSTAALQDSMVTTTTPGGQRVSICTCTQTSRHLATFTCRPGSTLYTLTTKPPQVAAFAQVTASGPVAPPLIVPPPVAPDSPMATALVTPPCHAFVACTLASLFLVFPVRLQLRERFRQDLPVLRLHSDRGGEFSSELLQEFRRGEGILQSFTLLASLQQNGIAERRIGLFMEVVLVQPYGLHLACCPCACMRVWMEWYEGMK